MRRRLTAAILWLAAAPVLPAAVYHVANNGQDSNPGSVASPLASIGRAAALMSAGDTCIIHGGTYRESVVVTRRGDAGRPLRFTAATGERVNICGTDPLKLQWTRHKGAIYRAPVEGPVRQLFVDQRMLVEARWPNLSLDHLWSRNRWAKAGRGSRYGKLLDPELTKTGIDWSGAVATLNVAHQFFTWTRTVSQDAADSNVLHYDRNLEGITHYADETRPWEDDRYYLTGVLAALDSEGEWFHDAKAGLLYLWAPGGVNPGELELQIKRRDYGIAARGTQYVEISGLHFFGCTVIFDSCNHCLVDSCHVRFPNWARRLRDPDAGPADAVVTTITGDDNVVRRSSFAWGPTSGLSIRGRRNLVDDCLLHDFCWDGSLHHPVIAISAPEDTPAKSPSVIRRCTLFNAGNAIINYRGPPGHVIELNHVYNGGRCCKDVALVYTGQPSTAGSIVRYNWVHGCYTEHQTRTMRGTVPGGLGIRGDDQTRSLTVHHNVVWDCGRDGIIVKGDNNLVFNNTVLDIGGPHTPGNYINLHTAREPVKSWRRQYPLLKVQNAHSKIINNIARTITCHNRGTPFPAGANVAANFTGQNPKLMDPKNFDFRPAPGSPLINAGQQLESDQGAAGKQPPDIGAYEAGVEPWIPGITWNVEEVLGHLPDGYVPVR